MLRSSFVWLLTRTKKSEGHWAFCQGAHCWMDIMGKWASPISTPTLLQKKNKDYWGGLIVGETSLAPMFLCSILLSQKCWTCSDDSEALRLFANLCHCFQNFSNASSGMKLLEVASQELGTWEVRLQGNPKEDGLELGLEKCRVQGSPKEDGLELGLEKCRVQGSPSWEDGTELHTFLC